MANAHKVREIGTREAMREQAVRVAELDKEQKIGEQTAGFQRDAEVKNAERDMRIKLAQADAKAVEGENLSKADIAASQAGLQVKKAEAYELGETRKVRAEAAVLEAQHLARAKAALAEAQRIEAERRAELEAPAKAEHARVEVDAAAEAAKRRIEAEGEASAIFARLEAEARGQYEILAKKGEGLQRIIDACGGSEQAFKMLMLEHFDHLVEASAKAISNIKFNKVVVWEGGGQNGASTTSNWLHNMARTLPPMMQVMRDIGGVEFPERFANLVDGELGKTEKKAIRQQPRRSAGGEGVSIGTKEAAIKNRNSRGPTARGGLRPSSTPSLATHRRRFAAGYWRTTPIPTWYAPVAAGFDGPRCEGDLRALAAVHRRSSNRRTSLEPPGS